MLGADQRGQAGLIGAVILFSFVVIAFSLYQATVVPNQNAQVEFNHNQDVQQDLLELRGGVLSTGASGTGTTTAVQLGTQYPARVFAVNPGPPSGSLRTVDPGGRSTLSIANAEAQNPETADFWSGTGTAHEYTTHGFVYRPNYNEYRAAPETAYENTVVYNRGPDGAVSVQTDQRLVSGRELDLTMLLGSYQADQSGSVSVDVSSPANEPRTVAVQRRGDPINVTLPTGLSESAWTEILEPEFVANGGYVNGSSVTVRGGLLSFELRDTDADGNPITYELRVPAAGIGTGVPDPAAAYVTTVSGDGTSIPESGTQQVVAEVRNEFNGPETGVNTCAALSPSSDGTLASKTDTTAEDGRTSFTYEAPDDVDQTQTAEITVGYVCDGSGNPEPSASAETKATFTVDVLNADGSTAGGGNGDSGGPNAPSIDSFTASTDSSNVITINATFSDPTEDGDTLQDVSIEVVRTNNGATVYSDTVSLSGDSDSLTGYQTNSLNNNQEYRVTLVVSDTSGNTDSDERIVNT